MDPSRRTAGWWMLRALALLAVVVIVFGVLYFWPDSRIIVGPETTYLSEPLDEDGNVDYLAAINQRAAEGVTPENNAAVLYWRALGPRPINREHRTEFFRQLGMKPLPVEGEYFESLFDFQERVDTQKGDIVADGNDERWEEVTSRHERRDARREKMGYTSWVRDDDPLMAQWLDDNQKSIDLFVTGTRRPRHFVPKLFTPDESEDEPSTPVLNSSSYGHTYRRMTETLMWRAMLHSGSRRHQEAWQDCLAVFRLVRHAATERDTVGVLVSYTQLTVVAAGVPTILHEGEFTVDELERMRQEFRDAAICASIADAMNWGDRLMTLDAIRSISRVRRGLRGGVDWNQVLRDFNRFYDIAAAEMKRESDESGEALLDEELELFEGEKAWLPAADPFSRWARSRRFTILMGQLMLPAISAVGVAERRCEARLRRIEIVFALSLHRARNGKYPKSLSALVPTFLDQVPIDPMNDQPMHYRKQGEGYLVWSVGINGRNDDGRTEEDREDLEDAKGDDYWDDQVFRVPRRLKAK